MEKIIEDRNNMSQAADKVGSIFDLKIWISKHQNIFEKLLAKNVNYNIKKIITHFCKFR